MFCVYIKFCSSNKCSRINHVSMQLVFLSHLMRRNCFIRSLSFWPIFWSEIKTIVVQKCSGMCSCSWICWRDTEVHLTSPAPLYERQSLVTYFFVIFFNELFVDLIFVGECFSLCPSLSIAQYVCGFFPCHFRLQTVSL